MSVSTELAVVVLASVLGCAGSQSHVDEQAPPGPRATYLGAAACAECHPQRVAGFMQTAHQLTTQVAAPGNVAGVFSGPGAVMLTRVPGVWFEMRADASGLYQTAKVADGATLRTRSERVDLVIGSGHAGQSYLYWDEDRLYQLPLSYFAGTGAWANSPGYTDGEVHFNRPVSPRCLECHATLFEAPSETDNVFVRDHVVLGISCERCHGPGSEHVAFHRANPGEALARFIVHPARLERARQLDLCAQCHSGVGRSLRRSFTYRPGEVLAQHLELPSHEEQNQVGVHTVNQLARLSKSRCFQGSPAMTCATCHDPHALERGQLATFSRRCAGCHGRAQPDCRLGAALSAEQRDNCIDCHMPRRHDQKTVLAGKDQDLTPELRDHAIGIFPREVARAVMDVRVTHMKVVSLPAVRTFAI